ncbi:MULTISPECIES: MarR family winged helix-turn-helix transcriptional regulator [Shouchella]|uniref:MarR family transcriptional regulator n=2 Tax=Shouchella TaxID=2893057 RepID=A0ABY7W4Z2_9BACI|nr:MULTISPECIES: MarR family transcriptional regulator [Shouchella]MED4127589.1 MarR family transcriptional regulator [Shouchella miscanthi]WDF04027.1 MarR family transcriptional regulator [Shouchella hunanensis]GAF23449.1 transcriptional regulator, MarR family [Bacillus sp. JCM 19047]
MKNTLLEAMDVFKDVFFYGHQIIEEELSHEFRELSPEQLAVLIIIDLTGPLTSKEIAEYQRTHKSAVSNRLKKLQQKKLIQFKESDKDSRLKYVHFSEEGKAKMKAYQEEVHTYFTALFSDFEAQEVAQFYQLMNKIRDRLRQYSSVKISEHKQSLDK